MVRNDLAESVRIEVGYKNTGDKVSGVLPATSKLAQADKGTILAWISVFRKDHPPLHLNTADLMAARREMDFPARELWSIRQTGIHLEECRR